MGISAGPDIITNGLVLELDAGDRNSYPGTGTTWRDLSGNSNNGTLTNGPTFNTGNLGSIVFDGVDDYASTTYNSQLGNFTAAAWFKSEASTAGTGYHRILEKSYNTGFWMGRNLDLNNAWGGGILNTSSPFGIYITLNINNWHYLVTVRSGSTHTIYGDGINNTASTTCSTSLLSNTNLTIGTDYLNGYFKGNIASVQIYNRALSSTEILQNYTAMKTRFGL